MIRKFVYNKFVSNKHDKTYLNFDLRKPTSTMDIFTQYSKREMSFRYRLCVDLRRNDIHFFKIPICWWLEVLESYFNNLQKQSLENDRYKDFFFTKSKSISSSVFNFTEGINDEIVPQYILHNRQLCN